MWFWDCEFADWQTSMMIYRRISHFKDKLTAGCCMHDAKDFKLFHATQITCKTSIVLWLWITLWDERWCHENWLVSNWGAVKVFRNWVISIHFNCLGFCHNVRFCAIWYLYLEFRVSSLCHSSLENSCSGMKQGTESHALYSVVVKRYATHLQPNFPGVSPGPGW